MIYLDSSCLVKLYYSEPETPRVMALVQGKPICYTALHGLELANAMRLKLFTNNARPAQIAAAEALVAGDQASGSLVSPVVNWTDVFKEAATLSAQHAASLGTRSLDILHCALAKLLGASEFVTTDLRQQRLAAAMGLNLLNV